MRRCAAALAALLIVGGCTGGHHPHPTTTTGPAPTTTAPPQPGPSSTVEESFLLEQIHRDWVREVDPALQQLWGWCGGVGSVDSSQWPEHRTIRVLPASGGASHATTYVFSELGYDADLTRISYGEPDVVSQPATLPGSRYVYDLRGVRDDGKFSQTDTVTLDQTRSVTVTHGVEFDASAKSDTKVEGEYLGTKIEEELEVTVGYKDSEETAKASSESKSVTTSHSFDVALDHGAVTYISVSTADLDSSTAVSIDGVADATVTVTLGQPCAANASDGPAWWTHSGRWIVYRDNEHIWDCWHANPHGFAAPLGQGAKGWLDWQNWVNSHPCPWTTTMGGIREMLDGYVDAWAGMRADRHGLGSGSWLDRQPAVYRAGLQAATGEHLRRLSMSGLQQRSYQRGTETVVSHIDPGDIDGIVAGGAKLCPRESTTC